MLRSVEMVHFRAQVPNRDAAVATRAIASEGLLHLVDIAHGRTPYDASPPGVRDLYAAFRDITRRIRATADRLGVPLAETAGAIDGDDLTGRRDTRDEVGGAAPGKGECLGLHLDTRRRTEGIDRADHRARQRGDAGERVAVFGERGHQLGSPSG